MNVCNLGIEQTSRPCTNQNSVHPPQRNGDVLSDKRESFGGLSTFTEFLFSACGDRGSTKLKKYNSNKCILANSFSKPRDKVVSCVMHKTYSCTSYEKSYVTRVQIIYAICWRNCPATNYQVCHTQSQYEWEGKVKFL